MKTFFAFGLLLATTGAVCAQAPAPAVAPAAAPAPGFWGQSYLLGDLGGARAKLHDAGWSPFATWSGELLGNVRGGIRDGMTNDMQLQFGTEADLEKIAGWQDASARISVNYMQGTRLDHDTGALNAPTNLDAADQLRVYNLYLRQKLFDKQVSLKVGQIGLDDDFAQTPGASVFLNPGVTAQPVIFNQTLANTDPAVPHYPLDAPGIFARYDPDGLPVYCEAACCVCDAGPDASNNHGFDWKTSNGPMVAGETGWNFKLGGRPGTVAVGGAYMDGEFLNWNTGAPERGLWGVYAFASHALIQSKPTDGGDATPVLTAFCFTGWAGPQSIATPVCNYAAGVSWNGPLPSRPNDVAGLVILYTGFSRDYTRSTFSPVGAGAATASETDIELTYDFALASWFNVQPDAQLIFNPNVAGTRATAVVVGVRATINF